MLKKEGQTQTREKESDKQNNILIAYVSRSIRETQETPSMTFHKDKTPKVK